MKSPASCRDCGCDLPPTALACPVCRTVRKRTWVLYIVILVGLICAGSVLISVLKKEPKQSYALYNARDVERDRKQQEELDAAANAIAAKLKAEREATRTAGSTKPSPTP